MTWLLTATIAIAFVEALLRLPLMPAVMRLLATARQVRRVISSSRISDHWKEKILVVYAGRLLGGSLQIAALLTLACAAVAALGYTLAQILDAALPAFLLSVAGTAWVTAISLVYLFARSRVSRFRLVPSQL